MASGPGIDGDVSPLTSPARAIRAEPTFFAIAACWTSWGTPRRASCFHDLRQSVQGTRSHAEPRQIDPVAARESEQSLIPRPRSESTSKGSPRPECIRNLAPRLWHRRLFTDSFGLRGIGGQVASADAFGKRPGIGVPTARAVVKHMTQAAQAYVRLSLAHPVPGDDGHLRLSHRHQRSRPVQIRTYQGKNQTRPKCHGRMSSKRPDRPGSRLRPRRCASENEVVIA